MQLVSARVFGRTLARYTFEEDSHDCSNGYKPRVLSPEHIE